MTSISLKLTAKELDLLCSLASDQLFRREFIDARLPGFKSDPAQLGVGKNLVERLRIMTDRAKRVPLLPRRNVAAV